MKLIYTFIFLLAVINNGFSQEPPKVKVMTIGTFHFDYPNLDVKKTEDKDKISVLEEPYRSEIIAISKAVTEFNPTIIAVELKPSRQMRIDSLYLLYINDKWELGKNEVFQLGFRIGKNSGLDKIYCVDDPGRHYPNLIEIFNDSLRLAAFTNYYLNKKDTAFYPPVESTRITGIIDALIDGNHPDKIRTGLSSYLHHPFRYEENQGDFTGVDFETGRWFNRNLRIFRNIQRIPQSTEDRILLIIGTEHLNLLNLFFDVSREYELVSPLPYIEKAKDYLGIN
jgi:hypothetical protein